jgi:hypothetical protein
MAEKEQIEAIVVPNEGKWFGKVTKVEGGRMWEFETPDEEKVKTVKDHIRWMCHKMGWKAGEIKVLRVEDTVRKT